MTHDTYSHTYWKPFAIYDPNTQSLKTFEDTLILDLIPFSETLPQSGMMRNGVLFERPKQEHRTKEPGFSLLRTLVASEVSGGIIDYERAKANNNMVSLTAQIRHHLPTPRARDYKGDSGYKDNVSAVVRMLPTPTVSDTFTADLKSSQQKPGSMHSVTLPQAAKMDWAQFEPAIERWEVATGRKAPAPLLENQKLNPAFTEWLMGLPEGWITDIDISWSQMIKACGNGVVPQQAKLALERLIP